MPDQFVRVFMLNFHIAFIKLTPGLDFFLQKTVIPDERVRSKTPNVPRRILSPVVTTPRKAASPGFALQSNGNHLNNNNNNYSYLIKPSAVRPGTK